MAAESKASATAVTPNTKKRARPTDKHEQHDTEAGDKRFAAARIDPRFSRVPKKAKRHVADQRFKAALVSNPGFRDLETPVDRFGRPKKGRLAHSIREAVESDEDDFREGEEDEALLKFDEGHQTYNSSSDEEDSDELLQSAAEEEDAQMEAIPLGKATKRLAVLGLDWSTTRAVDIFASLDSFCPPGKHVVSVEVHPSKFGLERLEKEATLGPQVLSKTDLKVVQNARQQRQTTELELSTREKEQNNEYIAGEEHNSSVGDGESEAVDDENEDDDEDDDDKKWREQLALRKYEEERLKYYYAVVQFADEASADAVYKQCDGVEYAQSGLDFDLRFIPADMKIETKPRDCATKIPDGYSPPEIASSSLNTSRVKLSWDADNPERVILKRRTVGKREEDELNLKAYLASSSDEEDDRKDQAEEKRRLLLGAIEGEDEGEDEDMNMQISFEPGMFEKGEEIVRRKQVREEQKNETMWEARMRRQAERKAEKRKARRSRIENNGLHDDHERQDDELHRDEDMTHGDDHDDGGFDDAFFAVERSFEDAENGDEGGNKNKSSKRKKEKRERRMEARKRSTIVNDEDDEMQRQHDDSAAQGSGLESLLAVEESDDEEEHGRRRGGRRRAKERNKALKSKSSAMDVEDERFEKMYSSHLFAIDRTHRKFKDNETNQRILAETMRRRRTDSQDGDGRTGRRRKSSANEELRELAGRLKARAKTKAKTQGR
eukprot:TRINITY_DN730_c0_g1_i1.p3 TRINITY_DN730_c0_g1~~TRINITY_DN730_c0_g1_i1.p3  ORF type:complete len:722 (-),score=193.12 TRINITY_DN730_c0_g1_i1:8856-11021(-)